METVYSNIEFQKEQIPVSGLLLLVLLVLVLVVIITIV
jgi:hypothetical protein